ncbi:hypothetical protein M758_7G007500 [Ceratodon purpureus]|uniref:Uncharacterized protein n=1 Tax=Ceratodon purpureus TaxID=3225 RepID=A0A8T0H3B3_CERPU|nr:hypothetical protein KC19_7G007900 [Ceratodon purpureus]KAG0609701.1 hypothetical protein M758_7G007500 [Ceratodon purpureus]
MGNCHAVDPVCATVEHPNGKVEKLYFSASARQLMLLHPGHYVALVPPPPAPSPDGAVVRVKRKLKLLPPDTMLNIGSCYRLVSFEDVLAELSERGSMAHQTSRKRTHSNTAVSKQSPTQPVSESKEQVDISKSAVKHMNQLRSMLTKSFSLQKENIAEDFAPPPAPATANFSSIQSPLQALHPVQRGGAWRPSLQSIAERGR